jgi:hypothetical membrane protein
MKTSHKILLICGIIIPLFYISIDTISAFLYQGYIYTDQAISELSAIGAPTAWIWTILNFVYNPLLVAFGIGVLKSADSKRGLRISGILMIIGGILGFGWLFFPMNMRGNIGTAFDVGHLVMSAVTVLTLTLIILFGSGAAGKRFRIYSILTIIVMLGGGGYSGTQAPRVAAQLPTPWMGTIERVSVFLPLIWILVLAVVLLRARRFNIERSNIV